MSVTTADHNLVNNVLQPLTNGDDIVDVDVRHELGDASISSKENSEVKVVLSTTKEIPVDDIVAKATDAAAEALLLHLETNGDLATISTTEAGEESHEEAQLVSTVNGASNEHSISPAVEVKVESTQDALTEPSIETVPVGDEDLLDYPSVTNVGFSIESETAANSSMNDGLLDVTESDELEHAVTLVPSLEDAVDTSENTGNTPPVLSIINVADTHSEQTQTTMKVEDNVEASASASFSEDASTAEIPTITPEAAVAHSSSELEEKANAPDSELVEPTSHGSEPHDVPSRVAVEKECLAEEIGASEPTQVEGPTPITSDVSLSQSTTITQILPIPAEDTSILDDQEPMTALSEGVLAGEGEVAGEKVVQMHNEAGGVGIAPSLDIEEPAATSNAVSSEEAPMMDPDALAQVDMRIVGDKDEKASMKGESVVAEVAVVEEGTTAHERNASVDDAPVTGEALNVEGTSSITEKVVVEAVSITAVEPVVEEIKFMEVETPATNVDDTVVEDVMPVVQDVSAKTEEALATEDVPAMNVEASTAEQTVVVTPEPSPINIEAPFSNAIPVVEEEVPAADLAVVEVTAIEDPLVTNTEIPAIETETQTTSAEIPIVENALIEEVPTVEQPSPSEEKTSVAEADATDVNATVSTSKSGQAVFEFTAPPLAQEDETEALRIPVVETASPSPAQPETIIDEKPIETSSLQDAEEDMVKGDPLIKAEVEIVPSQIGEAVVVERIEEPAAEEARDVVTTVLVDEPSASKEDVALEEFAREEVIAATEEQLDAVIVDAGAEEGGTDNTEKNAIPVTHSELEPTIDNNLQSLASEPVGVLAVDHKEILYEKPNFSNQEPAVDADELEPGTALPAPVDESVISHAKSTEDHKPVMVESHPDVQMTTEEFTPAIIGEAIEYPEEGQFAIPFGTQSNVGQQVSSAEDTSPPTSAEDVEAPNLVTSEATSTDISSVEETIIEAHSPITDAPTEDIPEQLEDSLTKSEREEPQVETETSQIQSGFEPQEVNPTVDELPTLVTQSSVILAHEEALAAEAAIEEAKTTEDTPEINYTPTIPLPIDEISEEVPEVAQQGTGEPLLEVHAGAEPPVSAPIEGVIVLERELTREALDEKVEIGNDEAPTPDTLEDGLSVNILSETSPAPSGEIATTVKSDDPTEASLPVLSKNEQHFVDEATLSSSGMTSVQESIDVTAPTTAPEEALVIDETSVSEEMVDQPVQEHGADVVGPNVDEHNTVPHAEDTTDTVIPTLQERDHLLTAEYAPPQETEHIENSIGDGQVETIQEVNLGEAPATEENAPMPEQLSTHVINDQVYSAHVELATVSSTEAENIEEITPATNASFTARDGPAANDIFEPPTAKDLESEFDNAEDEGQLHIGGMKPTEQLTALSDELLSPASGTEIERPKSPWTPSFQVTTVGRGVSSSDEDEEVPMSKPELFADAPILETPANEGGVVEAILEVPHVVTPVEEKDDVVEDSALPPGVAQSDTDNTTLDTPPAEIARPWTPSYSVHSQGSPLHDATELVQEVSVNASIDSHEQTEDGPELPDMEFAVNEEASKGTIPIASPERSEEVLEVLQQYNPAVTEAPGEISALPSAPPPIIEDAPADQAATTSVIIPTVIKDMDMHARNLQADVEVSHVDEDTRSLELALDAAEKDIATQMEEVPIEESGPVEEIVQVPQLVLNTGDDVTEPYKEPSVLHLTPQQPEQTQERPTSPSWVASYSVSTQGSPLQEHAPLTEELGSTIEVTPEEPSPTSALTETHSEVTVQHNIPQEPTEALTADETHVKILENETYAEAVHIKTPDFMVLVNDAEANTQEDTPPATSVTLVDNLPDRPKSPWTPSYSVTMQGPGTPGDEELDNIEPLPQRALDTNTTKNDFVEPKDENLVPEPEQFSSENGPLPPVAESKLPPVLALERELQELQATIHSDRDATPVANVAIVDAAAQEYFPSVETTEQMPKLSKLSVSRLAPVDEVEGMDAGPITSETVSSPSSRSRLESTTSSRFFPGGWFSTASKVADEGRTSLEIAQGEFTPSKIITPVPPAGDVSDTPDDASATSVATGHATDSDDDDDEPEPKRRWCVVM